MLNSKPSNQLRWVILLLAIAVILPTVCLLWFMSQAVKNERLAVRQRFIDLCNERIQTFQNDLQQTYIAQNEKAKMILHSTTKPDVWMWLGSIMQGTISDGIVIFESNDNLIYPNIELDVISDYSSKVYKAFESEQKKDYAASLEIYQKIIDSNSTSDDLFASYMGKIRCLEKLEKYQASKEILDKLLYENQFSTRFSSDQVAMFLVRNAEWLLEHKDFYYSGTIQGLSWYSPNKNYRSQTTIWALERLIDIAFQYDPDYYKSEKAAEIIKTAQNIIRTETISSQAAEILVANPVYKKWQGGQWMPIPTKPVMYASQYYIDERTVLLIKTKESFISSIESLLTKVPMKGIYYKLYDSFGNAVSGDTDKSSKPILQTEISEFLPGWKLDLYFEDSFIFDDAAKKQAAIYYWTGILAATLVLSCGAVTIQAIKRQAKLNKLKNDFIATITHELKTPLSSMRVLVDTLLEGRCENRQQGNEYLQLISKENLRLSRLIDNFLTFSRMERNKQVFEFSPASPVEIANSAAEAVHAKFEKANVYFSMNVAKLLPMINADKDALTTVLINLLDNAYKYSNENKQIELNVFAENSDVCFEVRDNGIGMTRRQMKRIFERFYQVDTSLSRRAEGSGLGLSIVKFIVNAHKGKINVESKIGKGSIFIVKINSI